MNTSGITDMDEVVKAWAVRNLLKIKGKKEHSTESDSDSIKEQQAHSTESDSDLANTDSMDVDWKLVKFSTAGTTFKTVPEQGMLRTFPSQVVLNSKYNNGTPIVQKHNFQAEHTVEATVKTKLTAGFTKSGAVGITIDVPELVANATGSFKSEIPIVSEEENTVKHTMAITLQSEIKAQRNCLTHARVAIQETEHKCSFEAEVHIRGNVLVKIRKEESEKVMENDIATILGDEIEGKMFTNIDVSITEGVVVWKVSGQLHFKFAISHDVEVSNEKRSMKQRFLNCIQCNCC